MKHETMTTIVTIMIILTTVVTLGMMIAAAVVTWPVFNKLITALS